MRELINCIAATAAWTQYCAVNRLVDCPELRRGNKGYMVLRGYSYLIARCMALTMEVAISEQFRREQPRIIPFNGRA